MFLRSQKIVFAAVITGAIFLPALASAATLSVRPAAATYTVGSTFNLDIVVDSADQALNAVSGQLSFPASFLGVVAVAKTNSILSYWVKEPVAGVGVIEFEGIVPNPGFRGGGGKIATITFQANQAGQATLTFTTGSVLANDGAGTNILDNLLGATLILRPAGPATPPPPPVATKIPLAPTITSSTHPDPDQWYNQKDAEFSWPLKSDITGVNILANKESKTDPGTVSDGLFDDYTYNNLIDGQRYLHVKFRNAAGWGPTSHFKFSIDTVPPENLVAILAERATTTDPRLALQISAADQLSGLDHYLIQINDLPPTSWTDDTGSGVYELTLSGAGEYDLTVVAFDRAGNTASTTLAAIVEAMPITPTLSECPTLPVGWWNGFKAGLTPDLLLAASIGAGLCLLLIMVGLILGRGRQKHFKRRLHRETREAEAALHQVFEYLRRQKTQQIDILELAKTKRQLTPEETLLLERLKTDLDRAEKLLKKELADVTEAIN